MHLATITAVLGFCSVAERAMGDRRSLLYSLSSSMRWNITLVLSYIFDLKASLVLPTDRCCRPHTAGSWFYCSYLWQPQANLTLHRIIATCSRTYRPPGLIAENGNKREMGPRKSDLKMSLYRRMVETASILQRAQVQDPSENRKVIGMTVWIVERGQHNAFVTTNQCNRQKLNRLTLICRCLHICQMFTESNR